MYLKMLVIIAVVITVPLAVAYVPEGQYIWFNITPATNSTMGGVLADECPVGELPFAIYENGTFACKVP